MRSLLVSGSWPVAESTSRCRLRRPLGRDHYAVELDVADNYSELGALRHLDLGRQVAAAALLDEGLQRYLDPKRAASSSLVIAFGRLC